MPQHGFFNIPLAPAIPNHFTEVNLGKVSPTRFTQMIDWMFENDVFDRGVEDNSRSLATSIAMLSGAMGKLAATKAVYDMFKAGLRDTGKINPKTQYDAHFSFAHSSDAVSFRLAFSVD